MNAALRLNPRAFLGAAYRLVLDTSTEASALRVFRMGAAMSFYLLFSAAPLLVALIGIASLVFDPAWVTSTLVAQLGVLFGPRFAQVVSDLVANFQTPAGAVPATVIGIIVVLWSASRVFIELHDALNVIWGVPPPADYRASLRVLVRQRALSFALVIATGVLLTLGLLIHPLVLAFGHVLEALVPDIIDAARTLNIALSFAIAALLLAAIYRLLPDTQVAWRDVWLGAALSAGLLVLGGLAFRLFLHLGQAYTVIAVAASPLVVLSLLQYAVAVIYTGAIMTRIYARRFGSRQADPGRAAGSA